MLLLVSILSYGKKITLNPMIRYTKDHLMLRIIKIMLKRILRYGKKIMMLSILRSGLKHIQLITLKII